MRLHRLFRPLVAAAFLWLGMAAAGHAVTVERVVSPGGVEAWLVQDHSNPIVAVNFAFRGGRALDPDGKAGLAEMVAGLLDEGAGDLDSQAFHGKLDDLGIFLSFGADTDVFSGQLKTLVEHRDEAFDLLRLALTHPRFDADAVDRVRSQLQAAVTEELQDPGAVASRTYSESAFAGHPYGRFSTVDTLAAVHRDDLVGWVPAHMGRDRLIVGVVGDITADQLGPLLDRTFGDLPVTVAVAAVPEVTPQGAGRLTIVHRPIPQSVVVFGKPGLKRDDPDWYAAYVMSYILGGGGFSSRLMTEVRVKRGLAYGVSTSLLPRSHAGLILGEVATRNQKVSESLAVIRDTWRRMAEGGVTAEELASAKTYLNGSFPLQMDSTGSIASLLVTLQRDNLGIDYLDRRPTLINAVTQDDVRRVARRLLDPDALAVVVVGDPAGMSETPPSSR